MQARVCEREKDNVKRKSLSGTRIFTALKGGNQWNVVTSSFIVLIPLIECAHHMIPRNTDRSLHESFIWPVNKHPLCNEEQRSGSLAT